MKSDSNSNQMMKKFILLFPLLIVTLGIFYFINLFERLYERDLNRELGERNQLMVLTEALSTIDDVKRSYLTIDTFNNTYAYLYKDINVTSNNKKQLYHSANCPFALTSHPSELEETKKFIENNEIGSFITENNKDEKIIWKFKHFSVENENLLAIIGVTNYPKEAVDKELEISIGIMLLITAILNSSLVYCIKKLRDKK